MKSSVISLVVTVLILFPGERVHTLENGLALTPPMGWMAWERFTCETDCNLNPDNCISSKLFISIADRMIKDGYRDLGYKYINIDDCWSSKKRDARNGRLLPDPSRFPEGIKKLSQYISSLGLKLGIYGDCGTSTCAGYPGQLKSNKNLTDNHFETDAKTLVDWQIESFKFDGCNIEPYKAESICPEMSRQLLINKQENRSILLSCEWPFYMLRQNRSSMPDFRLAAKSCNLWRYYEDIEDSWVSVLNTIDFTVALQDIVLENHGPGQWFDPDQLLIGNFGLSLDEARAQMAIWGVWSAPMYMSNDLRDIDPSMASILKNKNLIEVNQDRLGVFGLRVESSNGIDIFVKPVEPIRDNFPSIVIACLNRNTLGNRRLVSLNLSKLLGSAKRAIELAMERYMKVQGFTDKLADQKKENENESDLYQVKDLFEDKLLSSVSLNKTLDLLVNPSGVRIVKLLKL